MRDTRYSRCGIPEMILPPMSPSVPPTFDEQHQAINPTAFLKRLARLQTGHGVA